MRINTRKGKERRIGDGKEGRKRRKRRMTYKRDKKDGKRNDSK